MLHGHCVGVGCYRSGAAISQKRDYLTEATRGYHLPLTISGGGRRSQVLIRQPNRCNENDKKWRAGPSNLFFCSFGSAYTDKTVTDETGTAGQFWSKDKET